MAVVKIINDNLITTKSITTTKSFNTKIKPELRTVKVNQVVPFRVKFTNIGIESYSPSNPAPIGIAVIGINNYIL